MNTEWQAGLWGAVVGAVVSGIFVGAMIGGSVNGAWERAAIARGVGTYNRGGAFLWKVDPVAVTAENP